ncbi:MAG: DNA recombination protein RmuC [Saprospiraceae bacterium]|nr:DNA recombination protein RmuC [Saprospiraceae bacterium]
MSEALTLTIISSIALIGVLIIIILLISLRNSYKKDNDALTVTRKGIDEQLFKFNQYQYQLFDNYQKQLNQLQAGLQKDMEGLRSGLTDRLEKNEKATDEQLDKMRHVVEEKLHKTLEQRLGKSFELVNQSLLEVQKGLGEMQTLASGVGDLKKVLSNVKTRGILGEIQLGSILEQMLSQDQYGINVATVPGSGNFVEFAIKFPGAQDETIWLPIDAKFPLDKYEQLVDAYEDGDPEMVAAKSKMLIDTVKKMAKDINEKYIAPPYTTDFGILFLPVEGLYAELARDSALMMDIQRDMKIMIAGPSNLAAFLTSLRLGFKTLAIEKRSAEVWKVLEDVKNEFWKFGEILAKTQKKLQEASNVIDKARGKTTTISRRLAKMEKLPESDVTDLLDDVMDVDELP